MAILVVIDGMLSKRQIQEGLLILLEDNRNFDVKKLKLECRLMPHKIGLSDDWSSCISCDIHVLYLRGIWSIVCMNH